MKQEVWGYIKLATRQKKERKKEISIIYPCAPARIFLEIERCKREPAGWLAGLARKNQMLPIFVPKVAVS